MAILKTLSYDMALARLWDELVYTEARLLKNKLTVDLVSPFTELIDRCENVELSQRRAWRQEIQSEAMVDNSDDELDDHCDGIFVELKYLDSTAKRPQNRLARYLGGDTMASIIRLGLASEIERVHTWPSSLKTEPEDKLKELGVRLDGLVASGRESLAQRSEAAARRADQRAREILPLFDDANSVRRSTFGRLVSRAEKHGLAADWPRRFFRRGAISSKSLKVIREPDGPDGGGTPSPTK